MPPLQPFDLSGKTALITGASRGIGAAVAKAYAKAGAHVILLARTQGALEDIDDEIRKSGGKATLLPMDLAKLEDVDKIGRSIAEQIGKLDILVCNAGVLGSLGPVHDINPKEWDKVMTVNCTSHARLIRSCHALLRNAPAGRVIFTGIREDKTPAYWSLYIASKTALRTLAETYAAENEKTNIRINTVYPGVVETKLLKDAFPGGYPGKTLQPDDVTTPYLELASETCTHHGKTLSAE